MARSAANFWDKKTPYEKWIESVGVPIHRGYFIEDCRTMELGYWPERGCDAAFIQLAGQEGVTGAYVTEIPPGRPYRLFAWLWTKSFTCCRAEGWRASGPASALKKFLSGKATACFLFQETITVS